MKEIFERWLINVENKKKQTAYNYKMAIGRINRHLEVVENLVIDLYETQSPEELKRFVEDYDSKGRYSEFGKDGHGTIKASIKALYRFLLDTENRNVLATENEYHENEEPAVITDNQSNFSYEKELKSSIIYQIEELFPNYRIYGEEDEGVEYLIDGRRIDILLESNDQTTLLALVLKSGVANCEVFGQISMYLGLLSEKFTSKVIKGCIVAGEIDEGLKKASLTNTNISLKRYEMQISLENV